MTIKRKEKAELQQRRFVAWLMLNYRNGGVRVRKSKPERASAFEIPVKIDIIVHIPKRDEIVAKGDITLSQTKVREMFIESL